MQMIINYIIFQVVEQKAEQVPEQKPQPAMADNNYISAVLIVKQKSLNIINDYKIKY